MNRLPAKSRGRALVGSLPSSDPLESRRQRLLATVALQRFALRGDVGSLRASLRPAPWTRPVAAALAISALVLRSWTAFTHR